MPPPRTLASLQCIGPLVRRIEICDEHVAQGLMQLLLQAVPCTLRSLHLRMRWGTHMEALPQLLALARSRFASLERLELSAPARVGHVGLAALQQPALAAAQQEVRLVESMLAGIAALAGTLTVLKLSVPAVPLPTLAPLTALQRLRQLVVASSTLPVRMRVPALAQFPCLEQFELQGGLRMEVREQGAGEGPRACGVGTPGMPCTALPMQTQHSTAC